MGKFWMGMEEEKAEHPRDSASFLKDTSRACSRDSGGEGSPEGETLGRTQVNANWKAEKEAAYLAESSARLHIGSLRRSKTAKT